MREHRSNGRRHGGAPTTARQEPNVSLRSISWRRLFGYLKPYWARMALATLALLAATGLGLAFPLVIVQMLDVVTKSADYSQLNLLALVLLVMFGLQAAFTFVQSYLLSFTGEHIVYDLRTSLFDHLQELSLDFYTSRRVGEIVSRLSSDVTQMRAMLTNNLTSLLSQLMTLIGSIIIVVSLNANLTLFILGLVPLILLIAFVFGSRIQRGSTAVQDELADSTTVAEEALQGIRIVKSFGREAYEGKRYDKALDKTFKATLRMSVYSSLFAAVMMFLGFGAITAIIWYGGRQVIDGTLTLAMISGFLIYGISIAASLGGLGGLYGQVRAAIGGVHRVFEIMDTKPTVQDTPNAVVLPASEGRITFNDVHFSYEVNAPVIRGISLDIQPGEILALVGPSGAGKSTLFNLIPRFYDPTSGFIEVDGHDLRTVTQASLRDQLAIVPQETILFGGTIRENILYGKLDASEAEVIAAARAANAHDFIVEFPNGYDTVVGERGAKLSGGQRQRISIARAILKDPRILLLDEATSSLDSESEGLVQEALERLMQNRTTVIIAHRLSTIKVADRIAVIENGRIRELGTHSELMELEGLYTRLYSMQFRDPEALLGSPVSKGEDEQPKEEAQTANRGGLFRLLSRA